MKLGLGTVQLGIDYGIANRTGKLDKAEAVAILHAAADGGIECFDTAAAYGDSEEIIGRFIKESGFQPKLCTKFSCCALAERELRESLACLGVERLDYFLLHKPAEVFLPEFGAVLESIRKNPAVGKVGVSVYSIDEVLECLNHGVEVLQIPFNIIDSRLVTSGLLKRLKSRGVELHARSIYLQGMLISGTTTKLPGESLPPGAEKYLEMLEMLAKEQGLSVKELCFLYVRDCGDIDRFFIGCETVEQVVENLALYRLPKLSKEFIDKAQALFGDVPDKILNPALW
jgi:aryl-alcohol dehydrogenase-like predicted oxidoreductase